jgi:CRISPR-associated endoribonuclease Cas6
MRFKITLETDGKQRMLPMDYQYCLSAWIHNIIANTHSGFSDLLHSEGYTTGARHFHSFNYSPLDFGKPTISTEESLIEITTSRVTFNMSFCLSDAAEKFIAGMFNNQQVYVGDKFNGLNMTVVQVERLTMPALQETMHYRTASSVVVSLGGEQSKYAKYMPPGGDYYPVLLRKNLWNKHNSIPNAEHLPEEFEFGFISTSEPKQELTTIKPYTPQQICVRGFVFDFSLTCPPKIHQLILAAGLGEKNSMGFGWCEVKEPYRHKEDEMNGLHEST